MPRPAAPSATQLQELARDAGAEGLAGALLRGLALGGVDISPAVRATLQRSERATLARNLLLLREAGRLARAWASEGVAAVFLKGTALLEQVYLDPGLRAMRDVDVLVPLHQADLARATARSLGWSWDHPRRAATRRRHCKQNLVCTAGPHRLRLELHAHVDGLGHRGPRTADLLGRARSRSVGGAPALIPSAVDLALHLAVHWSTEGLMRPLRETLDLACLLRHDGLSVHALRAAAGQARAGRAAEALLRDAAGDGLLSDALLGHRRWVAGRSSRDGAHGPTTQRVLRAARALPAALRPLLALAAAEGPLDGVGLLTATARRRLGDAWAALHEGSAAAPGSTPGISSSAGSRSTQ